MFIAHLALEKAIKAHVTKQIGAPPPKSHQLLYLAQLGNVKLPDEAKEFLQEMQQFNIEGRYPENRALLLTISEAENYTQRTLKLVKWLIEQL